MRSDWIVSDGHGIRCAPDRAHILRDSDLTHVRLRRIHRASTAHRKVIRSFRGLHQDRSVTAGRGNPRVAGTVYSTTPAVNS
jgi:hypothetical protein